MTSAKSEFGSVSLLSWAQGKCANRSPKASAW